MHKSLFLIPIITTTLLSGCFVGIHGTDDAAPVVPVPPPIFGDTEVAIVGLSEAAKTVNEIGRNEEFVLGGSWIANKGIEIKHAAITVFTEPIVRMGALNFYPSSFNGDSDQFRTTFDWIKDEGLEFSDFTIESTDLTLNLADNTNTYEQDDFWNWGGANGDHYKGFTTTKEVDNTGTLTAIYYTTFQAREKLTADKILATGTEKVCLHAGSYPDVVGVDYTCITADQEVTLLDLNTRKSVWNEFYTIFKVNGADGDLNANPYENGVYVCRNFEFGVFTLANSESRICHIGADFALKKEDWLFVRNNENSFRDPDGGAGSAGHGNRFYGGSPLDWLSAAVWLFVPEDETDTAGYTVGAFAHGRNPSYGRGVTPLTGTATYSGKSSGIFFDETATTATNGKFEADFALTADFGTNTDKGRVSGVISNIKKTTKGVTDVVIYDGKITFAEPDGTEQNVIDTDKSVFTGDAIKDTMTSSQTEHDFTGKYEGGFFHGRYTDDGVTIQAVLNRGVFSVDRGNTVTPNLVTGTFSVTGAGASTSDISTLVGIFYGQKEFPSP